MKRSPMRRSQKPLKRGRLNKIGRRGKVWKKIKKPQDKKLFESNLVFCLVCGSSDVTRAHPWRRWHSTEEMLAVFAPLCATDHHRLDALGERYAFPLISYLLETAEGEREPEINFNTASDDELRKFAAKLMSEEEFWKLRRNLCQKKINIQNTQN